MGRGGDSPSKRRINAQRNDKRAQKNERRRDRAAAAAGSDEPVDEAAMMARFHELNERRAAGEVSEEAYEAERHEIFVALGLEHAFQSIQAEAAEAAAQAADEESSDHDADQPTG